MINSISISNFKSIQGTGELRIAPLTFFIGPNSSGKSSILKSLLVAHQTAISDDTEASLQVEGKAVSLGSFQDLVYMHDLKKQVTFKFSYSSGFRCRWATRSRPNNAISFKEPVSLEVKFIPGAQTRVIAGQTTYRLTHPDGYGIVISKHKKRGAGGYEGVATFGQEEIKYISKRLAKFYDLEFAIGRDKFLNISRSTEAEYNLTFLLTHLTNHFQRLMSNIFYIGPIRKEPLLIYVGRSEQPREVGILGEDALQAIWVGRYGTKQRVIKGKVDQWMKAFGIAKSTRLRQYGSNLFQYYLTDLHTGIPSRLIDVGFGASQLLPLIVEGYLAPINSLILAEQPEIHLHPKAQAIMADMMIDIIKYQRKKLIVETHSEHLLARLLTRIAQGVISNNDLAIYYCNPTVEGTQVINVKVDEKGRLDSTALPEGFFEEDYNESIEYFKAINSKKQVIE